MGYTVPQLQARRVLEEVRLKMTVEANMKLLKSGFQIETAPIEELIKHLENATKGLNEDIWGKEDAGNKDRVFSQTQEYIKELPTLPLSVIGKIPFMEKATLEYVVQEGRNLQQQYHEFEKTPGLYFPHLLFPKYLHSDLLSHFPNV